LMEKYVKATDNDIDNVIFATVKAALLKWQPQYLVFFIITDLLFF
jgi:hypothetical protein